MSHIFRFLASTDDSSEKAEQGLWRVADEEVHHIKKVLKLRVGQDVEVFDGEGLEAKGKIQSVQNDEITVLCMRSSYRFTKESLLKVHLAIGALKHGDIDDIIAELCELGVDVLHVYLHEQVAKDRIKDQAVQRWRRIAVAACKQSKRAWIPELKTHASLSSVVAETSSIPERFLLDAGHHPSLIQRPLVNQGELLLLLGGEKGLNPAEIETLIKSGFKPVLLGHQILRARTAAIAAMAVVSAMRSTLD